MTMSSDLFPIASHLMLAGRPQHQRERLTAFPIRSGSRLEVALTRASTWDDFDHFRNDPLRDRRYMPADEHGPERLEVQLPGGSVEVMLTPASPRPLDRVCPSCLGAGGRRVWVNDPQVAEEDRPWKVCDPCEGSGRVARDDKPDARAVEEIPLHVEDFCSGFVPEPDGERPVF